MIEQNPSRLQRAADNLELHPSVLLVVGVLPSWERLRAAPRARSAVAGTGAAVMGVLAAGAALPRLHERWFHPRRWPWPLWRSWPGQCGGHPHGRLSWRPARSSSSRPAAALGLSYRRCSAPPAPPAPPAHRAPSLHRLDPGQGLGQAAPAGPGRTRSPRRRRPAELHGDKGYDDDHLRRWLRERGIVHRLARKGVDSSKRLGRHRWQVERTMAWPAEYRRRQN